MVNKYINSEDPFENFFAVMLVTGLRLRETLEYTQISKSQEPGYIVLNRLLKKRDCDDLQEFSRPCLYQPDIVILKLQRARQKLADICQQNKIKMFDDNTEKISKTIRNFFSRIIQQNSYVVSEIHDCRKIYANIAHHYFASNQNL